MSTRDELMQIANATADSREAAPATDDLEQYDYDANGEPLLTHLPAKLTPAQEAAMSRRNEVQRLVALGCSDEEIARRLRVSRAAIKQDKALLRAFNKRRIDAMKPSDVFGEVDAAYKYILQKQLSIAENADNPDQELAALEAMRKTIVSQMGAYKQLGIDRDIEAEAARQAARPPMHIQHVHAIQLPENVRQMVIAAALAPTLTDELAAPTPDTIDLPAIEHDEPTRR